MNRVIEIAEDGRHLSVKDGFLCIRQKGEALGQVPLDSVLAVIANAHGLSYTNNALVALAQHTIPLVVCGRNSLPMALLWPVESHHQQGRRMDMQLAAKKPLNKRLWQEIVQHKIRQQAHVLQVQGREKARLLRLAEMVKSGDSTNHEAMAARIYFPLLFGEGFIRNRNAEDINSLLNYGYTILRAAVARGVMAAGLHPGIPLHHANQYNAMRLVDDLMEPFRPWVDDLVKALSMFGVHTLSRDSKKALVMLLHARVRGKEASTSVLQAIEDFATSLAMVYEQKRPSLHLPPLSLPDTHALLLPFQEAQTHVNRVPIDVDDGDVRSARGDGDRA